MSTSLQSLLDEYRAGERGLPTYEELSSLAAGEQKLRTMLAHSYGGALMYSDDGELQDNRMQPFIDFKRDAADAIYKKMEDRAKRYLNSGAADFIGKLFGETS